MIFHDLVYFSFENKDNLWKWPNTDLRMVAVGCGHLVKFFIGSTFRSTSIEGVTGATQSSDAHLGGVSLIVVLRFIPGGAQESYRESS